MASNGAASINQVSNIFEDLSQNAQKAAIEIARLAAVTAKGLDLSGAAEQLGTLFQDLLQPVAPKVEKLATVAEKFGAALSELASGKFSKMSKAAGALTDTLTEVGKGGGSGLSRVGQQMGMAGAGLVAGTLGAVKGLMGFAGVVGQIGGAIVGAFQAVVSGAIGLGKALLNIPGWFQAAISPIQKMFGAISPFISALNPAYVLRFQAAMLDLHAVIGRAMVPFAEGLTLLTRSFADMMVPVSQKLKPVFEALGGIVQKVGASIFAIFGAALIQISPHLQKFALAIGGAMEKIVGAVAVLVPTLIEGFSAFIDWLASTAIPWLGGAISGLVNGTNSLVNTLSGVMSVFKALEYAANLVVLAFNQAVSGMAKAVNFITSKIPLFGGNVFDPAKIKEWDKAADDRADRMVGNDEATRRQEQDGERFRQGLNGLAGELRKLAGNGASLGAANRGAGYSGVSDLGRNLMQQSMGQTPLEERQVHFLEIIAGGIGQLVNNQVQKVQAGAVGGPGVNANGWLGNLLGGIGNNNGIPQNKFNRMDGDPNGI
jgi:hypothetical protein